MKTRPSVIDKSSANKCSDETHFVRIRREAKEIGQKTCERFLTKNPRNDSRRDITDENIQQANLSPTSFSIVNLILGCRELL